MDGAAAEFRHQFQRDAEMVTERCRKCVDEADRVDRERHLFVDAIEKTATVVRETVFCSSVSLFLFDNWATYLFQAA